MSAVSLNQDTVHRLIGEIFVYDMPFNRTLGLRLKSDYAELSFTNQQQVGNVAQKSCTAATKWQSPAWNGITTPVCITSVTATCLVG